MGCYMRKQLELWTRRQNIDGKSMYKRPENEQKQSIKDKFLFEKANITVRFRSIVRGVSNLQFRRADDTPEAKLYPTKPFDFFSIASHSPPSIVT
jgi:hypothetical protein